MVRTLTALSTLGLLMATASAATAANPQVVIETSLGSITVELFQDKAPISVKNFLEYTDDKHYDGTIFHRVIDGFMIQGGGFTPDMQQKKTKPPIKNEAANGLTNDKYTIAMARTGVVDSATSQFYVNVKDNPALNHAGPANFGYCVFGKVVAGTDVVDKIRAVSTGTKGGMGDVPTTEVLIKSVKRKM